jgi:PAS domain S-box-containing protein
MLEQQLDESRPVLPCTAGAHVDLADLAFLLENMPAPAAYINPEQQYCYVNLAYASFFGQSPEEIAGRTIDAVVGREHHAIAEPHIRRVLGGEPQTFLSTLRSMDGVLREVEVCYAPQRNATGEVTGFLSLVRDARCSQEAISQAKQAEEALRTILESMPDCVMVLDRNGIVLQVNPAGLVMVDAGSPSDVIGRCLYPMIHQEEEAAFRALNESVFDGGPGGRVAYGVRGLKGVERFVETNVVPLRGASSDTIIGALSISRDVTSSRHVEQRDAFLVRLDDATRTLSDPKEITAIASKLLCQHLGADRCSYAEIDVDDGHVDIMGNYSTTLPSILGRYAASSFGAEFLASIKAGRPYVFRDAARELPGDACAAYRAIGIAAVMAIPLVKETRLVAGMGVHQSTPRNWRADEVELVRTVANRCWESIERARVQRELRASEELFRSIVEAAAEGIWIIDVQGRTTFVNRRMTELLGYGSKEMLGRSCFDFLHPDEKERGRAGFEKRKGGDDVVPREYRFVRQDGSIRWLSFVGSPMHDAAGRITGVLSMCTDTTERRLVEERIRHLNSELVAKLSEVETLLNVVPVGIAFSYDAECRTVKFNAEAQRIHGIGEASIVSMTGPDMPYQVLQNGIAVPAHELPLQRAANSGEGTRDVEYEIVRRDGRVVQVLCSASPVFDAQGRPRGSVAALLDITDRKQTENALRRANTALEQFAYAAAHDLQEPARNVSIYTQLLAREYENRFDAAADEYMKVTVEGAHRMQTLIQDLLSYARTTNEGETPPHAGSDGNAVFAEVVQNLRTAIEIAGAEVSAVELPSVVAVRHGHFVQLLQNLVSNALKYRGVEPPKILVSAAQQGPELVFRVKDNGLGIAPEFHERIFGVFKRLHGREIPGTGIGLAVCERIVSYYGGRIWVESELGEGASFCFTLPAARRSA